MEAFQAAGSIVQGVAGYETGRFNKRVADVEAIDAMRTGAAEEARVRDAARAAIGEQVASQGANGFQQGTGSALDALANSQVNAAMDGLEIRRQASARARSARVQGALAKAQGDNALVQGMLGAGAAAYQMKTDWAAARSGTSGG